MSGSDHKSFRFIVPVENLPGINEDKSSLYNDIINEFLSSKLRYAEVILPDRSPRQINMGLRHYLKKKGIKGVRVRFLRKKVYLEREVEP